MNAPAIPLLDSAEAGAPVLIKFCGFREPVGYRAALEAGTAAVGLNFWPGSKRAIPPDEAKLLVEGNPHPALRIGVFVNPTDDLVLSLWYDGIIAAAQLHGNETVEQCQRLMAAGLPIIRAFGWNGIASLQQAASSGTPYLLADAHAPDTYGGTGRTMDWYGLRAALDQYPGIRMILSGGLTPANVAESIAVVRPVMVDAASGVEVSPGVKDPAKLAAFATAVRGTDRTCRDNVQGA